MKLLNKLVPKYFKNKSYRNKLELPALLPPELSFKIAFTQEEYQASFKILYDSYVEKGYDIPNKSNLRVTPYHLIPTTSVLLALWKGEVIGTVSLIRDNPLGLPLEKIFHLSELRKNNKVLCEVSALAIKKEFRGSKGEILFPLIRYMWSYAMNYFGVDYLVIAVNPSMSTLYEAVFHFQPLSTLSSIEAYDFANNNPAIGKFIHLKSSYELFKIKYKNISFSKNLSLFMEQKLNSNHHFPERKYFTYMDAPVSPEWYQKFSEFFSSKNQSEEVSRCIANAFGFESQKMMLSQNNLEDRKMRIPVSFEIVNIPNAQVIDISENGLKIISEHPIPMETSTILRCLINHKDSVTLMVSPVWKKESNVYGLQITKKPKAWGDMIQSIYNYPTLSSSSQKLTLGA
jgi:hypothetical protein